MKLPIITARELIKILERIGFITVRQKGSHLRMKHSDGRRTTVPIHKGQTISRGLLRKIIREDIKMSVEDFVSYM